MEINVNEDCVKLTREEHDEYLEKIKFLTEENKRLREHRIKEEQERELSRMEELDRFRESCLTWWHCIEQAMKMYEASLGNEHRLRHEREKLLKEIAELREQVGVTAVYRDPKEKEEESRPARLDS